LTAGKPLSCYYHYNVNDHGKQIYNIYHRHPDKAERPGFRKILLGLLEKEEMVLNIPSDMVTSSQEAVLGAPLEAGFNLYPQLQSVYCDYAQP
jgi:hypothetical protein